MNYKLFYSLLFFVSSVFLANSFFAGTHNSDNNRKIKNNRFNSNPVELNVYETLNTNQFALPKLEIFVEALKGFNLLKEKGLVKKNILTLIDFTLSSNSQRLWVIDLDSKSILFNTLVAHGRNSGEEFATSFSNASSSFKSSLGFYATGEVYTGKHGLSLKLDGLVKGFNNNARERAVVIHGADYVSENFIQKNKRLGRSLGCPAIPIDLTKDIIQAIKDKSCVFIYHSSKGSQLISKLL